MPAIQLKGATYSNLMKLPLGENAFVEQAKARFFIGLGFRPTQWNLLAEALCAVGTTNDVSSSVKSTHGTRYVVDGLLETSGGRSPKVRTVWILEPDGVGPRLVTAYPVEMRE